MHYKQTVLYYILLIGHIESNPGPNIVSGKPNLKNGSLKIAHINACISFSKEYKCRNILKNMSAIATITK
jgi:hypothetical protein